MSVKLISYLHFKNQEAVDVSFLRGFYDTWDKPTIYRLRQWVGIFLYDLKFTIPEFNKGVKVVERLYDIQSEYNLDLLYRNIDINQVLKEASYLTEPYRKGDPLSIPVVEATGKGSYCSLQPNPNLRKANGEHKRAFLDLNTIALTSKVVQPIGYGDFNKLDKYFDIALRARLIHERTHTRQINLEDTYDKIKNRYHQSSNISEWDAVDFFIEAFMYDVTAWSYAVEDRIALDNGESENSDIVKQLALLDLTHTILIAIIELLQHKKITLYNFSFNISC